MNAAPLSRQRLIARPCRQNPATFVRWNLPGQMTPNKEPEPANPIRKEQGQAAPACISRPVSRHPTGRSNAMWTKPAYTDLRIGFEVTMYFANR